MAARKKKKKPSDKKKIPWGMLFWLAFAFLLLVLYLSNREAINNSIRIIQREFFSRDFYEPAPEAPSEPGNVIQVPPPRPVEQPPPEVAVSQPPAETPPQTEPQDVQPQTEQSPEPELRDRALYFIRVGSDGSVLGVRSDRRLPASDSPLRDVIQVLIAGPSDGEAQGGLISLIPQGTRLLSVTIRGETAYINFNEDFQYNTYGREGYVGQLRQIVFTATEFPNVMDVQILIEGSRVDFLGENIWIGSPLNRGMF